MKKIPYGRQSINQSDIDKVIEALNSELLTTGTFVEKFEKSIEEVIGNVPCFTVSSGTAALHAAYYGASFSKGDEIITPPLTFIATQATAKNLGIETVFADVLEDTGTIDPEEVRKKITQRTRAVVAVDYAGHPAELTALRELCDEYSLLLIEDAAHSFGSTYRGQPVGSIADITTFSFYPTKNIATGEGGAVASRDPEILFRAKTFSRQGLIKQEEEFNYANEGPWHQEVHNFGLNYRLSDIHCALGLSQIKRLEYFKSRRKNIFDRYSSAFSSNTVLRIPTKRDYVDPMWHLYPIRVDKSIRKNVYNELRSHDILVQVNYFPAHLHPVFHQKYEWGSFQIAEEFYKSEISLPMSAHLVDEELEYIIDTLNRISRTYE